MTYTLIPYDQSSIVITRHSKVAHAGGFSWVNTVLPAQTVRLIFYTTRNMREYTSPEGETKQIVLGIVGELNMDAIVGHDSWDSFDVLTTASPAEIRTFRIVGIRRYDDVNIEAHSQADCVAV